MKISLQIDGAYEDTEILIRSPKLTPELEQIGWRLLRKCAKMLSG